MIRHAIFALDCAVIIATAAMALAALRIREFPTRIIAFLVLFYSAVVLPAPFLSALDLLNSRAAHLLSHLILAAAAYAAVRITSKAQPLSARIAPTMSLPHFRWASLRDHSDLLILLTALFGIYLVNLAIVLFVAQHTNDALAYHLPRAMYWIQNGNTRPFGTHRIFQTTAPMNSSLVMLWTILHSGNEHFVGLIQYCAVLGSGVTVYALSRLAGFDRIRAITAAAVWLSLPIVVVQSTTAQNDMTVAFLIGASVYCFALGTLRSSFGPMAISAIALANAMGTKVTSFLFLPSFILLVAWSLKRSSRCNWRLAFGWGGICIVACLIFAAPIYLQNYRVSGQPMGKIGHSGKYLQPVSVTRTLSTLARFSFELVDTTGLPVAVESHVQDAVGAIGKRAFETLGLDPNGPQGSVSGTSLFGFYRHSTAGEIPVSPPPNRRHEDTAWAGPLGATIILPCALLGLLPWRRLQSSVRIRWLFSSMAAAYVIAIAATLPWDPWRGRFMAPALILTTPLIALAIQPAFRWTSLRTAICLLAAFVAWNTVLYSKTRPLLGDTPVFRRTYIEQRSAMQYMTLAQLRATDSLIPDDASIGALSVRFEHTLFGQKLRRFVTPVFARPAGDPGTYSIDVTPQYVMVGASYMAARNLEELQHYLKIADGRWGALFIKQVSSD